MKKTYYLLILCFGLASMASFAQDHQTTGDINDYRNACNEAIDNMSKITGSYSGFISRYQVARNSIRIMSDPRDIRTSMAFLRADIVANYLQIVKTFEAEQDFTGLIGNHSFDTGELSWWNCFGFDLSKVTLADVTRAIAAGSVSPLTKAVTLRDWNEETMAVENTGDDAVSGGQGKFFLNSNQLTMQPVFGLPAGIYTFRAKVACKPGLLGLNKVHLNALVVSSDAVRSILGIIVQSNQEWEDLLSNFKLTEYIQPILENGELYTASVSCKNLNTFSDGEVNFIINEGDLVILGMDSGLVSFIGAEQYRADNIQLVGRWSAKDYLAAKAELAKELEGQTKVEANCNADWDGESPQPPFTYDQTITSNFNQALAEAQDLSDDKLTESIGDYDLTSLKNLSKLDETSRNHFSEGIRSFKEAKNAFYTRGFIAPEPDSPFNILMKDEWTTLFSSKWTGNAVTLDKNLSMRFSKKPGEDIYSLGFCFESASDRYSNLLRAYIDDNHDKYYLAQNSEGVLLSINPQEAITIEALPSYTTEGEIKLKAGDKYLGTSSSKDNLILTDLSSLLRTTRTGLSVVPAAETALNVSLTPVSSSPYATLILPFDAPLPEGCRAFTVEGIRTDLPCIEAEEHQSLKANTPYLIAINPTAQGGSMVNGKWQKSFAGPSKAILPNYSTGLLAGGYSPYVTSGTDEFVLATDEDGFPIFRQAAGISVAANTCYLKSDTPLNFICIDEDHATAINDPKDLKDLKDLKDSWDLTGRRVNPEEHHGIYIVGGKKILVK